MISFKQEINKKQKFIAFGLLALCLVVADLRLFVGPTLKSIKTTGPQLSQAQRKYAFAKSAVVNIPRYKQQIDEFNSKLSLHKKRFSTNKEISSLLKELSTTARNTGVKIVAVRPHAPQEEVSEEAYRRFPISINAVCGFHQLGVFLNSLENADTFMRVTDIKITSDPADIKGHQVYILINTYIISGEGVS